MVIPLHTNKFRSESRFISQFVHKSNKVSLGTVGYIVPYCNRFIMLFTQIIHQKQTNTKNKTSLILQYSTLKSTVVQYNSWHTGAGIE